MQILETRSSEKGTQISETTVKVSLTELGPPSFSGVLLFMVSCPPPCGKSTSRVTRDTGRVFLVSLFQRNIWVFSYFTHIYATTSGRFLGSLKETDTINA